MYTTSLRDTGSDARYKGYRAPSARLNGWNYASSGLYFVTICTRHRHSFFGDLVNGEPLLSSLGIVAGLYWQQLPIHSLGVVCDEFMVMPNHIHGILRIAHGDDRSPAPTGQVDDPPRRDVIYNVSTVSTAMADMSPKAGSLGRIVQSYKAAVSRWSHANGYEDFGWQSRYYEHIIRSEESPHRIRQYIRENPANWPTDENNPANPWRRYT